MYIANLHGGIADALRTQASVPFRDLAWLSIIRPMPQQEELGTILETR